MSVSDLGHFSYFCGTRVYNAEPHYVSITYEIAVSSELKITSGRTLNDWLKIELFT